MNQRNDKGLFVSGYKETNEEKIKRAKAIQEAWKNRPDYIGDIRLENPRIYNSWRAIKFTEKGKKAGNTKEWDDFRTFYNDVRPLYKDGLVLRRKDISKIWSKDNFMWVSSKDYGLCLRIITVVYKDQTYTLKQASELFGIPYHSIKNRYYKHPEYTQEEIIFGKRRNRKDRTPKDWKESANGIRSKASKMISSYKHKDKTAGFENICDITIEWMIDNIITKPYIYCGDTKRVGCDRINNDLGHNMDNVVPCCYDCNCARNSNFTFEEMKIIGETIKKVKQNRAN